MRYRKNSHMVHLVIRALLVGSILFQVSLDIQNHFSLYGPSGEPVGVHYSESSTIRGSLFEEESAEYRFQRIAGILVCQEGWQAGEPGTRAYIDIDCARSSWQPVQYHLFLQQGKLLI